MKLCKDCKYFYGLNISPFCTHPAAIVGEKDLIYGSVDYQSCEDMRKTLCGSEGKLYEPKHNETL